MKPVIKLNLAATLETNQEVIFPKYASPKYDGIRCVVINGQAWSRNMILIPNLTVQDYFADGHCNNMDGELICGAHDAEVFKRTSSIVRSVDGSNQWHFKVFDSVNSTSNFASRLAYLRERVAYLQDIQKSKVSLVPQTIMHTQLDLQIFEEQCIADGYEGAMLRNPGALYKAGRSTAKSQDLLKVKRFEDSEAIVLGWTPLVDIYGVVHAGTVGSLQVQDIKTGVQFSVGSGFSLQERRELASYSPVGSVLTYQFFAQGAYEKPRFPTFKSFRPVFDVPPAKL